MRNFNSRKSFFGKSVTGAVLLAALLSAQSASAQEQSALTAAFKYAEVAIVLADKVAISLNNVEAAVEKIDLMLQEVNMQRFDAHAENAEQCAEHKKCQ